MTPVEYAICVTAFFSLSSNANKKFNPETHQAIAANICASANKNAIDPRLLAAYILTENGRFDPFLDVPAKVGIDRGLFHTNSHFHGNRANYRLVNHPYYAADIATEIILENFRKFGGTWQGVAAYWSPMKAKQSTGEALRYYQRWQANYKRAETEFRVASDQVTRQMSQGR